MKNWVYACFGGRVKVMCFVEVEGNIFSVPAYITPGWYRVQPVRRWTKKFRKKLEGGDKK